MAIKCTEYWPAVSTGTISHADINDRAGWVYFTELVGTGKNIWWTLDGTQAGGSLFSDVSMPAVGVMASASGGGWTQRVMGGQVFVADFGQDDAFIIKTWWHSGSSTWITQLWRWGDPTGGSQVSNSTQGRRQFVLTAIGVDY